MTDNFMIETDRLILRHWRVEDAGSLYRYASIGSVDHRVAEKSGFSFLEDYDNDGTASKAFLRMLR